MQLLIEELINKNGETLVNVPADASILLDMGFSEEEANQLVDDVVMEHKWTQVRAERDHRMALTDWTQMPDSPLTTAMKDKFAAYRQTLRDIPESFTDPDAVVWPDKPAV